MTATYANLDGHVAMVTGGGSGMGARIAQRLAEHDMPVAVLDIDGEAAEATVATIRDAGGRAQSFECDVRSTETVRQVVADVTRLIGLPDRVVHGAGIIRVKPFLALEAADWEATLAVNLTGTFTVLQTVARQLVDAKRPGRLVAISSIGAARAMPDGVDYAASKAAVNSLVRSAAVALAPHEITINAVCPGMVDTPMTSRIHAERGPSGGLTQDESMARGMAAVPLGRMATTDDVANAALFLLSDEGSYMTGQAVNVCGGLQIG